MAKIEQHISDVRLKIFEVEKVYFLFRWLVRKWDLLKWMLW